MKPVPVWELRWWHYALAWLVPLRVLAPSRNEDGQDVVLPAALYRGWFIYPDESRWPFHA